MKVWTYAEARDKVLKDLDIEEEDFIQADEMVGYFNEAIDICEAEVLKLNEDYFLTVADLTLVAAQSAYALPADIYANKIRKVLYSHGTLIYAIDRLRGDRIFEDIAITDQFGAAEYYRYYLRNDSAAAGYTLCLTPPSRESGAYVKVWHLRNANRVPLIAGGLLATTEAAKLDLPECVNFLMAFVKVRCLSKDMDPRTAAYTGELEAQRALMIDTLTEMVPDDDNHVLMDLSFYMDHE